MNARIGALGLLGLWGCSSAAPQPAARMMTPALAAQHDPIAVAQHDPTTVAQHDPIAVRERKRSQPESAQRPLAYHDERDSDRVFIENAERAIREYREFIARAGDSREYAAAVERSREQIDDLQATLAFVREGLKQRH